MDAKELLCAIGDAAIEVEYNRIIVGILLE